MTEGSRSVENEYFGHVDDQLVNSLLSGKTFPETLESYLKDGRKAEPDDSPETTWQKIEFIQNHSIVVDSQDQRNALDGGYYDTLGQSVDGSLQLKDKDDVSFNKGDELVVKSEVGSELIASGVAELREQIYVRPLNDYEDHARHVYDRLNSLAAKAVVLTRGNSRTTRSIQFE